MAAIDFQTAQFYGNAKLYKWEALSESNTEGLPVTIPSSDVDVTVHVHGTIGGATVAIHGSLNGVDYTVVDDAFGNALSYTSLTSALKPIGPALIYVKPVVTGGSGVDVDVELYIVNNN